VAIATFVGLVSAAQNETIQDRDGKGIKTSEGGFKSLFCIAAVV